MRGRQIAGVLLALALFTGCAAALAAGGGGSSSDPLVSQSYLEDVYIPALKTQMKQRAEEQTAETYAGAEEALENRIQAILNHLKGVSAPSGVQSLQQEDQVTALTGSAILPLSGSIRVTHSGTVIDVTEGKTVSSGSTLTAGHRYVTGSGTTAVYTVTGSSATAMLEGTATLLRSSTAPLPFTDVAAADWFYEPVRFVYEEGLFNGVTAATFAPQSQMTRGMLATVLYRMAGSPAVESGSAFDDVPASSYYAAAISWAAREGIVDGMSEHTFAPDSPVTREQMAAMLYRYATRYAGLSGAELGDLTAFADVSSISSWARESVEWVVGCGIMEGSNQRLNPGGNATRAEVAAMLQRFSKLL